MASVRGNIRHLQHQINRTNTAPMGPVIFGPSDRLRLLDANGNTVLDLKHGGPLIRQAGSMVALATELEAKAALSYVDGKVTSLLGSIATKASNSRVDSLQTQINTNDGYRINGDAAANGRIDTVQAGVSTLNGEMDDVQSGISTLNGQMANRATTSQINYITGVVMGYVNQNANRIRALEDASGTVTPGQSSYVVPTL